jgi:hypothetical protein
MSLAILSDEPMTRPPDAASEAYMSAEEKNSPCPRSSDPEPAAEPANSAVSAQCPSEEELLREIRNLPPELAVLLLSVGALGFVLPGVIGTPAIIAGGLALWPKAFGRAENWFAKRFPVVHRKSLHQMVRFLSDLDRRYPRRAR